MSIQQVLENSLSQVLKTPTAIVGCGRTDAKVHASQFFFHVDIDNPREFDLLFRLNKILPADIAIFDIIPMAGLPHARFDATQRSYDYFIHTYKDPFLNGFSSYYNEQSLDLHEMKKAVALLPLYHDYRAFCKSPDRNEHTLCHVTSAELFACKNADRIRFNISANRFLSKMIRVIVGRLISIGTGEMSVDEFEQNLIKPQNAQTISPAHPQGLYLSKVTYPYLDLPARSVFTKLLQTDLDTWQNV